MDQNERESIIKTYFTSAKKRISGSVEGLNKQFFAEGLIDIWIAFDAFLNLKFWVANSPKGGYSTNYRSSFNKWKKSDRFNESLKKLIELSPVDDEEPNRHRHREPKILDDKTNLFQIMQFSYRIRSNLFHVGKNLEGDSRKAERNRQLTEHAFKVTYEILENTLLNESILH